MEKQVFQQIDQLNEQYVVVWEDICNIESPSHDKAGVDRVGNYFQNLANERGWKIEVFPQEKFGDVVCVTMNPDAPKAPIALSGHMDTVHPVGSFGTPAAWREGDHLRGPGAIDCKGGIAIAMLAMKALQENGYGKHLRLLMTSDEEVSNVLGGQAEVDYFRDFCAGFPYVINCETSEGDEVVISRKGILKYRIDIKGIGGHSGIHYFECKNAIEEAAHKILALHSKSKKGGTEMAVECY